MRLGCIRTTARAELKPALCPPPATRYEEIHNGKQTWPHGGQAFIESV
ncbi:hypothetical protein K1W54_22400 [Micromonospora sp. CPCC 205371]|nr:hypothetical protein [Micromonospora sp. CPCC 205371]